MSEYHFTSAKPEDVWPLIRDHHYSKRMPSNIQHCFVWREDGGLFGDFGEIVAASVWSIPPTRWSEDVIELIRLVRASNVMQPLSKLVSQSLRMLKNKGHVLVVSFADRTQDHHGGIYQSCGWNYAGCRRARMDGLLVEGTFWPGRSCNNRWGTQSPSKLSERFPSWQIEAHYDKGKHLYWKPICVAGKTRAKRLGLQSNQYPKPNAACPVDERLPSRESEVQPLEAAPT